MLVDMDLYYWRATCTDIIMDAFSAANILPARTVHALDLDHTPNG